MLDSFNVSNPEKIRSEMCDTQWETEAEALHICTNRIMETENGQTTFISPFPSSVHCTASH